MKSDSPASSEGLTISDSEAEVAYDPASLSTLGGEDFYRNFVRRTTDVILTVDASEVIVFANPAVERVFGYEPQSVVGEQLSMLVPERFREQHHAAFQQYVSTREPSIDWNYIEFPGLHRDGHETSLALSFQEMLPSSDAEDGPFFTAIIRDVSSRKAREAELTRYETIVNTIDEGVYQIDADGQFVAVNDAIVEKTGYDRETLLGSHASVVVDAADAKRVEDTIHRLLKTGEVADTIEITARTADGGAIPCELRLRPLHADGEFDGTVGVVRDVSQRRAREQALQRERDLTRRLLETAPTAIAVETGDGEFEMANQRARDLFRIEAESLGENSLAGDSEWSLYDENGDPLPDDRRPSARVRATGEPVFEQEVMAEMANGDRRWFLVNAAPVYGPDGNLSRVVVAGQNITERKHHERELEMRREQLETELNEVLGRVTDAVYSLDTEWRFTYVNERAEHLIDRSERELLGASIWEEFPEAVGSTFEREYRRAMESQKPVTFEEHYPPLEMWLEVHAYPSETGLSVYFRDVTERKRRERELEQYEAVVETVKDGIYALDDEGRFVMVNQSYVDLAGYSREELLGSHSSKVTGTGISERAEQLQTELLTDDKEVETFETDLPTADGSAVPIHARFTLFPLEDGRYGRVGVVRDVTEQRRREAELHDRVRQQRVVAEFGQYALADRPLDDVFGRAVELVADTLDQDYCEVLELRPEYDDLLLRSGVGWRDGIVGSATVGTERDSQAGYTLRSKEPVVVEDLPTERRFSGPALLTSHDVVSGISTIIGTADEVWGILGTHTATGESYADHDVQFVQSIANLLTTTIQRRQRERQLEALAEASGDLLRGETPEAICDGVVETASDDLSLPAAAMALYDDASGELRPCARTPLAERLFDAEQLLSADADNAWRAFAENEVRTFGGLPAADGSDSTYAVAVFPLGRHGVFVAGTPSLEGTPEPPLEAVLGANTEPVSVRILTANVESALDRTDRERQLVEREELLREQNQRLERLNRMNDVIRKIDQSLVAASTRAEIEAAVCSRLTDAGPYVFSWIGEYDSVAEELVPNEYAGADKGYLDALSFPAADAAADDPFFEAIRTLEPQVVDDLFGDPPLDEWRAAALKRGYRSCIVLPLLYKGTLYGVLALYADRANIFDDLERDVLAELGDTVGYALNAVESKKALISTDLVEIEFRVDDTDVPFVGLTDAMNCEFEFESVTSTSSGTYRVFFLTRNADPDDVREYLRRAVGVRDARLITESDDECTFECTVDPSDFVPTLLDYGAIPRSFVAADGEATAVVTFPQSGDVRRFLEAVQTRYDGLELLARREREREFRTWEDFQSEFDAELTDRQREVLRTAYFSGFFETPRESTGSEIGETLDISQPTFNKHLRAAQRKLFEMMYADE